MAFSDRAATHHILRELGQRCEQARLALDLTQAHLAHEAGVGVRTVRRLEQDGNVSLDTFVRVLAALGQVGNLELVLPQTQVRPAEHSARRPKERQRASGRAAASEDRSWTWGDEA